MNTDTLATDPLSKRTAELRKLFAKGTGRKPNRLEAMAIKRAALLTAKCEAAALDPETTANDLVRLDGAARKARADMQLVPASECASASAKALQPTAAWWRCI